MLTRPSARPLLAAALLGTGAAATGAHAQETADLEVTSEVVAECTVEGATLSFDDYTSGQETDVDGDTFITYSCGGGPDITIELSEGGNPESAGGDTGSRNMASGGDELNYELYQEDTRNTVWSESEGLAFSDVPGGSQSVPVYGRIFGDQTPSVGVYNDTVLITLNIGS